ncbi:hypothetical protein Ahy_B10g104598 [Arachis hypogaea]|uniref:Disease resistance protein n=1 Tax=Arachis hypogaea TaxID=3818 RepID=A0A444X5X5_ARAHY|nr:hypothetical protein Ahy_B10g104598 [Arachis hypogaea]
MPPSVVLRHYHRRLVVRASSSFKNHSFFLELGTSVPSHHLLPRALRHRHLHLVVVLEVPNPPIAASSLSWSLSALRLLNRSLESRSSTKKRILDFEGFDIEELPVLRTIFCNGDIQYLSELQKLKIHSCFRLEELIPVTDIGEDVLPKLQMLLPLQEISLKLTAKSTAKPSIILKFDGKIDGRGGHY